MKISLLKLQYWHHTFSGVADTPKHCATATAKYTFSSLDNTGEGFEDLGLQLATKSSR